jgi:hypothetical protein
MVGILGFRVVGGVTSAFCHTICHTGQVLLGVLRCDKVLDATTGNARKANIHAGLRE